jgi:hypothetical protein
MSVDIPRATFVIHNKLWAGWPNGEPQSVRDAYDQWLASKGEVWTESAEARPEGGPRP